MRNELVEKFVTPKELENYLRENYVHIHKLEDQLKLLPGKYATLETVYRIANDTVLKDRAESMSSGMVRIRYAMSFVTNVLLLAIVAFVVAKTADSDWDSLFDWIG